MCVFVRCADFGGNRHYAQLSPASTDPHIQIANLLYFSLNDYERSTAQLRKCLHSDPDSKPCSKLFRRIKTYEKAIGKARGLRQKRQFTGANKVLLGNGDQDDLGVIEEVKAEVADLKKNHVVNSKCPQTLLADLNEMVCDGYSEVIAPVC